MLFRGRQSSCDNRGYTLQTVIVMAILIAAAVGASVVLYRAINSNTDVRSLTDTAGTNAPSRPHNLVVEKTLETVGSRTVPSATVRWSPPLYTGFSRFGEDEQPVDASSASLLYRAEYGCADSAVIGDLADITLENIPDSTPDPTDMVSTTDIDESKLDTDGPQTYFGESTELSLPTRILGELFPASMPPETVYCILRATAYTCPDAPAQDCANPGDNESRTGADDVLTGNEIYSLESELIRFELSRAPTEILNLEAVVPQDGVTSTNNRVDLSWDTPEYTGVDVAHLYEIKWAQREEDETKTDFDSPGFDNPDVAYADTICTVANGHSLDLTLNADTGDTTNELIVDVRITPYAVSQADAAAAVPNAFTCPTLNKISEISTDLIGIELLEVQAPSIVPPTMMFTIPTSENIPSSATDEQKRTLLNNLFVDMQTSWPAVTNASSYELEWSRADGSGTANSRVLPTTNPVTDPVVDTLNLENDRAYNLNLTVNLPDNETVSTGSCVTVSHSQRTPIPDLEVIPISQGLRIRIAPHNQTRFCNSTATTLSAPATQHYKVRVYDPASTCASPGEYPNKKCSSDPTTDDDHNDCQDVTTVAPIPSAEEVVVTGLTANTTYEVEVIAGHDCDATAKTIGFAIPSPNPMEYGYPSAPVVMQATTMSAVTLPAAPTNVSATFSPSDTTVNYDRWTLSWDEVSGATSYLFTIDHDTTMPTPPDTNARRYAYTPSLSRATSFAARAPVDEFSCSKSGTTLSCTVPDDDQSSVLPPAHTDLKFEVWSVSNAGISATSAMQTTAEP